MAEQVPGNSLATALDPNPICPITQDRILENSRVCIHNVHFDAPALFEYVVCYRKSHPQSPILHPCTRVPLVAEDLAMIYDAARRKEIGHGTGHDTPHHHTAAALSKDEFVARMIGYIEIPVMMGGGGGNAAMDTEQPVPHHQPQLCFGLSHGDMGVCGMILCILMVMAGSVGMSQQ